MSIPIICYSGARPPPPNKRLPGPPPRPRPLSGPPKRPAKGPSLPSKRPDICPAVGPRGVALPCKPPVAKKPVVGPRARVRDYISLVLPDFLLN